MLFNTFEYLVFFIIVVIVYFLLPLRASWYWLLAAGCVFYMWLIPIYILILGLAIVIDYVAAIYIEKSKTNRSKKIWLIGSIVSTCALLFVFKYFNFFSVNIAQLSSFLGWNYSPFILDWVLPVGLSFHTFQSLAYVIEVYKGQQKAEYNFAVYSLYVLFFPQLVAGPIERPQQLLPQLHRKPAFDYNRVCDGLLLIFWGLFKKVLIADKAALLVNEVYAHPHDFPGGWITIAALLFSFQIYADFSGYSDMAIGSAKVMGFDLSPNFRMPYLSRSVTEFWRRWHISLSSWFRDYVYLPLGGSRGIAPKIALNIFLVFALSGLWHGAAWTFVLWGCYHAFWLIAERWNPLPALPKNTAFSVLKGVWTFLLVSIGWIFFRSENIEKAIYICGRIINNPFGKIAHTTTDINGACALFMPIKTQAGHNLLLSWGAILTLLFSILLVFILEGLHERGSMFERLKRLPTALRWLIYYLLIWSIFILGQFDGPPNFIYFQF